MKISELFKEKKTVFSFEIFPPNERVSLDRIYETLDVLQELNPDYISVTYSAGGDKVKDHYTCEISSKIKNDYGIESVAHLTCINSTKEEVQDILNDLKEAKVENILALRGDVKDGAQLSEDFSYADDLVKFIKEQGDFGISGACYPETHIDCCSCIDDIQNLKKKVDAGTTHLVSQLFFDNQYFYDFVEKARIGGIDVPIQAGIMPVVNKRQIERIVSMCGATIPPKLMSLLDTYEHNPEALQDAGIIYAVAQIADLLAHGVDGIHLYTMNNPVVAKRICHALGSLRHL